MPEKPALVRMFVIQVLVPSSVVAVITMQATMRRKSGWKHAAHIEPVETPRCTRSVFGKDCPAKMSP